MALNKYMHHRNIYKHKRPNFKELAAQYDFFNAVAEKDECGRVQLDFRVPLHLAALSKALLLKDFNLNVEFPGDRLIPTVPLRLNYILWLEDLLKDLQKFSEPIKILDIGVGASCIYPLLGARKNSWKFFGTETDMRNYSLAKENVDRNHMSDDIKLFHIAENSSSLDAVFGSNNSGKEAGSTTYLHAVMANPPFFSDASDAVGSKTCRSLGRPPPKTVSSAARHESQTTGGEVYYCMRLIRDSLRYSTRVGVFTIMLGKKSSVPVVRRILYKLKITQISVYEMCQGRIMRWGVAWTFLPNFQFPESDFRRLRKLERPPLVLQLPNPVTCLHENTVDALLDWLRTEFKQLGMKVLDQKNRAELGGVHLNITADVNTWTHTRRKRREAQRLRSLNQVNVTTANNSDSPSIEKPTEPAVIDSSNTTADDSKNPLKRNHNNNDSFEMKDISTKTTPPTEVDIPAKNDTSTTPETVNPTKRTRLVLTHEEICDEGEDAWDNSDQQEDLPGDSTKTGDNNNNNNNSNNQNGHSSTPITHLIQANVFVEYLNSDSFSKDVDKSSATSLSLSSTAACLFPDGIEENDEVMPYAEDVNSIEKNAKSSQENKRNCNNNAIDDSGDGDGDADEVERDDEDDGDDDAITIEENHGPLVIKIAWISGVCREAANQILFYLKNRLK
ncbi:unnamed protein product [Trichobilharzia szidati]|nr:unnamed protein product [Trichobilharzia szidati]